MISDRLSRSERTVELLLFGDLTASFDHELGSLLHVRDNAALQSFFGRVASSLRQELGRLPSAIQRMFPRFTTLIDLVAKFREGEGAPVLQFCLMTVCQLAKFIQFADGRSFPSPDGTYLLGICTGSFAASAISVSKSVSQVVRTGVEAVRIAFRAALCSLLRGNSIAAPGTDKPWSVVISRSKPVEALIESFMDERGGQSFRSKLSKPYISATSPTSATLSGPPSTLQEFLAQHKLEAVQLPIKSPYHAAHIFDDNDIEFALDRFPAAEFQSNQPYIPILSSSTGEVLSSANTFGDLLRIASTDVLKQVVRWENILESCADILSSQFLDSVRLYPFFCNAAPMLSSYLAHETTLEVSIQNSISPPLTSPQSTTTTGDFGQSKIAVIGYSGRFPEAASNEELWNLLRSARDVHRTIPEDRFNWETYNDPTGKTKNTSRVKHGCFINEPGLFDTRFFNMSPREADNTDPAHRLAITATYEAMEMAGMVPNRTPSTQQDRIGVFFGVTSDDWREANSSQNVDTYFIPGTVRAFMPGRISYFFRFSGPSLCIDTACSSSFAAIQSACGYLWRGECDTAVAGGTNVLTNPDIFTGLDRGHFLSRSGNCNTFDDEASGYCRADAAGAVILKRLDDALADKDPIFGVIAGANTNHCGQTDSITRPHEGDQASVFNQVLRHRNVDPNDISYVEMHGTGTQAGDATEMKSVLSVFLPDQRRGPEQPLYLGSIKACIGHSEAASGVSALIKVLLMMRENEIPPHCGIKTKINRNYPTDLEDRNVRIASRPTPWLRSSSRGGTRRAFINNFSAAGGNTALLLEDAPVVDDTADRDARAGKAQDARGSHIVAVTAKSAKSLRANVENLISFLGENPSTSLPALSYTTTARRIHHGYRVGCTGDSTASILDKLRSQLARWWSGDSKPSGLPSQAKLKVPEVAFVFTGQGSLYTNLGRELFDTVPGFRDDLVRFDGMAQQQGFSPFLSIIDGSAPNLGEVDTCAGHLALVCLQMALSRLWNSWNISPGMVVGHSLGEYAALFAAGVISASDAIFLVGTRAGLLARCCSRGTHAMLAVKAPLDVLQPLLESSSASASCELTCVNQPMGVVVGGQTENIEKLSARIRAQGYESVLLDIPYSFHTSQVDPLLQDFQAAAQTVQYRAPQVPVLSPLLGRVITRDESVLDGEYLTKACRGVVNFQGALEEARRARVVGEDTIWLEIGAHPICSGMIKATLGSQSNTLSSLRKSASPWTCITSSLESMYVRGQDIDWNNYHRDFSQSHQVVQLPRYGWDLKNHWILYKNDFLLTKGEGSAPAAGLPPPAQTKPEYRYMSPSVQRVIEESHSDAKSTLLIESDVHDSRLAHVLRGHVVNGASLCPSSLYGDIALTMAETMVQGSGLAKFSGFDVCDVKVDNPLIANPTKESQLFRVSAVADWQTRLIALSIYSVDDDSGNLTKRHASVNVRVFEDKASWLREWAPMSYLIQGRLASLRQGAMDGGNHRLKRSMVYKLFNSIVDYSPAYQGMQEVILDSENLEATAKVTFGVDDQGFKMNPHWIDCLAHIAGFIMNGNENLQSDKEVFINHGWARLRFGETPQKGKVYTTYNRMQSVDGKLYTGSTYVLDGERIVAVFESITFGKVPRKLLDNLLPSETANATKNIKKVPGRSVTTPPTRATKSPSVRPSPPPHPPPPAQSAAKVSREFDHVLAIIAEEVGVGLEELGPDSQFADLGLDSLLSLTVASRVDEEVGINLPSTIFVTYSTVGDLQSLLEPRGSSPISADRPDSSASSSSADTPDSSTSSSPGDEDASSATSVSSMSDSIDLRDMVRQTIIKETGAAAEDLTPTTCLADVGIDSLLGLSLLDSLGDRFDTVVPNGLLLESETLEGLEIALGNFLGLEVPGGCSSSEKPELDSIVSAAPHATSIALARAKTKTPDLECHGHGHGHLQSRVLFLLPDGSGSAASYATLARLDPSMTVYGINCPWRTTPQEMIRSGVKTHQMVAKMVMEIRRRQPRGPYHLGGWSAGGIFAFEAARQLMASGEAIESLLLVDAPNPIGIENPPARMFDFFESVGLFGDMCGSGGGSKLVPTWLRHHFDATVHMLNGYDPEPLPNAPPTTVIYARDGVCKDGRNGNGPWIETSPDDPREMLWLLHNRTDFSAGGWRALVGESNVSVHVLDDVNHFSMMNEGEHMEVMRRHIRQAVLKQSR